MKIVIDIPKKIYKKYMSANSVGENRKTIMHNLSDAIKESMSLPKSHRFDFLANKDFLSEEVIDPRNSRVFVFDKDDSGEITLVFEMKIFIGGSDSE